MKLIINTDGGARGNPGPAGIGAVIRQAVSGNTSLPEGGKDGVIHEISQFIGEATNNQAEYKALIAGLEWVIKTKNEKLKTKNQEESDLDYIENIECRLDSELVVKQLNGEYKMKNEGLKPLFNKVKSLTLQVDVPVKFLHIYREENKSADRLVNKAIDEAF